MVNARDLPHLIWGQIRALKPSFISKSPHFNFITVHYFWIIGLTLTATVLIFAIGNKAGVEFIDCLFFASGANTQAGLNTIDVNQLSIFQQVVIYICCGLANPIIVNSAVVFLRLYWFQRRFQNVVREANKKRVSVSKSRTKSMTTTEADMLEKGVDLSDIKIVYDGKARKITNDGILLDDDVSPSRNGSTDGTAQGSNTNNHSSTANLNHDSTIFANNFGSTFGDNFGQGSSFIRNSNTGVSVSGSVTGGSVAGSVGNSSTLTQPKRHATFRHPHHMSITFASTVKRSDGNRFGEPASAKPSLPPFALGEDHIAILERQRNPEDKEVLRIPNPREVERGIKPKVLSEGEGPDPEDEADDANRRAASLEKRTAAAIASAAAAGSGSSSTASSSTRSTAAGNASIEATRQRLTSRETEKRRKRDELRDNTSAITNTILSPLRLRKPFEKKSPGRKRVSMMLRRNTITALRTVLTRDRELEGAPYLSYQPTMGRNSQFVGLSEEQREELGGIEYRSLKMLAFILMIYFWGFELLSLTFMLPYILHNDKYGERVEAWSVSRVWWGFFTAHSAFQDLGFTLTPDSMASFSDSVYVLLIMSFFIIIGNTGFPVMLRLMIWFFTLFVPKGSGAWEELRFLLDHPRRCFTLLFPAKATWWLLAVLLVLNGLDVFFFIVLDLPGHTLDYMPVNLRFLNGWFVATCTRTAGFSSIGIATLHPAVQISYMIMMYVSIFPIAISIRRTNVYEEQSLGVYNDHSVQDSSSETGEQSYVGAHLRRQLSFDLWFLFLAFFLLAITEGTRLQKGDKDFGMFSILFECVSAYGTVGLSLGYPGSNTSFCGQFSTLGKLIIIALQIRGRHRGLPYGLDKAILLPSEFLNKKEDLIDDPNLDLGNTTSRATGFQSFRPMSVGFQSSRPMSLARGRTASFERATQPSFLSRVMQPGPSVPVDPGLDAGIIGRTMSSTDHPPRRTNTDPMSEDEGPYDVRPGSHVRPPARRAETLPTVKSVSTTKSMSSNTTTDNAGESLTATTSGTHVAQTRTRAPSAAPTFSTEPTAVEDITPSPGAVLRHHSALMRPSPHIHFVGQPSTSSLPLAPMTSASAAAPTPAVPAVPDHVLNTTQDLAPAKMKSSVEPSVPVPSMTLLPQISTTPSSMTPTIPRDSVNPCTIPIPPSPATSFASVARPETPRICLTPPPPAVEKPAPPDGASPVEAADYFSVNKKKSD